MKKIYLAIIILITGVTACKKDLKEIGAPASKMEGIMASWELKKSIQVDEVSLTKESFDVTSYFINATRKPNITFSDSTYTVDTAGLSINFFGGVSGKWNFDDPEYPTVVNFVPDGGASFSLKLNGPIRPQDNLRFSKKVSKSCKGTETIVMSYNLEFVRK